MHPNAARCWPRTLAALALLLVAACPAEPAPPDTGDQERAPRGDAVTGWPSPGDGGSLSQGALDTVTDGLTDTEVGAGAVPQGLVLPASTKLPTIPAAPWVPRRAPRWAQEPSGRVLDLDGRLMLVASDCVKGLGNPALARTAAGNRARARLAQVLAGLADGGDAHGGAALVLEGVEIDQVWSGAGQITCARARLPLAPQGMTQ